MTFLKALSDIYTKYVSPTRKKRERLDPEIEIEVESLPPNKRSASSNLVNRGTSSHYLPANNFPPPGVKTSHHTDDSTFPAGIKQLGHYPWEEKKFPQPRSLTRIPAFMDNRIPQPGMSKTLPSNITKVPLHVQQILSDLEGREALQSRVQIQLLLEKQQREKEEQRQKQHAATQTIHTTPISLLDDDDEDGVRDTRRHGKQKYPLSFVAQLQRKDIQTPPITNKDKTRAHSKTDLFDFTEGSFYNNFVKKIDSTENILRAEDNIELEEDETSVSLREKKAKEAALHAQSMYQQDIKNKLPLLTGKASKIVTSGVNKEKGLYLIEELKQLEIGILNQQRLRAIPPLSRIPLPKPSPDERAAFKTAIASPDMEIVVSHERSGIELRGKDIRKMDYNEWLNDEVINLYVSLLLERDGRRRKGESGPRCHIFNSFFLAKLYKDSGIYNYDGVRKWTMPGRLKNAGQESKSILECDRILIPVNQGNMHWVCAMIDLKNKKFVYFDSLRGTDPICLENLARYLQDEYKNKRNENRDDDIKNWPREFLKDVPQQLNGCDCGVFTLLFARYLSQDAIMDFTQDNINDFRVQIVCEMLRLNID